MGAVQGNNKCATFFSRGLRLEEKVGCYYYYFFPSWLITFKLEWIKWRFGTISGWKVADA